MPASTFYQKDTVTATPISSTNYTNNCNQQMIQVYLPGDSVSADWVKEPLETFLERYSNLQFGYKCRKWESVIVFRSSTPLARLALVEVTSEQGEAMTGTGSTDSQRTLKEHIGSRSSENLRGVKILGQVSKYFFEDGTWYYYVVRGTSVFTQKDWNRFKGISREHITNPPDALETAYFVHVWPANTTFVDTDSFQYSVSHSWSVQRFTIPDQFTKI